jgi:hypothetical protein
MFSSDFPTFGSFTSHPTIDDHVFPELQLEDYDALFEAFRADQQPFPLALTPELADELWQLTRNLNESLFPKRVSIPEVQENRFVESGFEDFGIGFDSDEPPPQSPSECSSNEGHSS